MSCRFRLASRLGTLVALVAGAASAAAPALKYTFAGEASPVYEFSIRAEYPDAIETTAGSIAYDIKKVDPANGQIQFSYTSESRLSRELRQKETSFPPQMPPIRRPDVPLPWGAMRAAPDIMISSTGNVLRSNRTDDEAQLPHLLGYAWQLMLQPLTDDGGESGPTWTCKRQIRTYTRSDQQRWPPTPLWQREAETRVEHVAREVVTYTCGEPKGNLVPVKRSYELATDEKVGTAPLLKQSGNGEFVFDTTHGLVQSLEMKYTIEATSENVSVRVPVTVSAKLLTTEEAAKFKAQREASAKANLEKLQALQEDKAAVEGTTRTSQIGGNAGTAFVRMDPQRRPMIGVRITTGRWRQRACLRQMDPLYETPQEALTAPGADVLAKPGYAVGGLVVNHNPATKEVLAVQVIFMRMENGRLSTADQYRSDWIADASGGASETVLGASGELVLGLFGRQGVNTAAIGLILEDRDYKPKAGSAPAQSEPVKSSVRT